MSEQVIQLLQAILDQLAVLNEKITFIQDGDVTLNVRVCNVVEVEGSVVAHPPR